MQSSRRLKKLDIIPRVSSKNEPTISCRGENIENNDFINPFLKNGFFESVEGKKTTEKHEETVDENARSYFDVD